METKTYLSQVTEGQKQRVTLEACDRAGSGKTCGKKQRGEERERPPPQSQSTPGEREDMKGEAGGEKVNNNKRAGHICYAW